MKLIIPVCILFSMSSIASRECDTSKIARDAIRAIALISDQAMITDLVGGAIEIGEQTSYRIWANYRNHGYSDKYEVTVDNDGCRVISLHLTGRNLPVQNGD